MVSQKRSLYGKWHFLIKITSSVTKTYQPWDDEGFFLEKFSFLIKMPSNFFYMENINSEFIEARWPCLLKSAVGLAQLCSPLQKNCLRIQPLSVEICLFSSPPLPPNPLAHQRCRIRPQIASCWKQIAERRLSCNIHTPVLGLYTGISRVKPRGEEMHSHHPGPEEGKRTRGRGEDKS